VVDDDLANVVTYIAQCFEFFGGRFGQHGLADRRTVDQTTTLTTAVASVRLRISDKLCHSRNQTLVMFPWITDRYVACCIKNDKPKVSKKILETGTRLLAGSVVMNTSIYAISHKAASRLYFLRSLI